MKMKFEESSELKDILNMAHIQLELELIRSDTSVDIDVPDSKQVQMQKQIQS